MMIFWFTGLAVAAVGKTAGEVVREVRRQFKENPGIMEYKQKPDYRACVSLVTEVSAAQNHVRTETAPPPPWPIHSLGLLFFCGGERFVLAVPRYKPSAAHLVLARMRMVRSSSGRKLKY